MSTNKKYTEKLYWAWDEWNNKDYSEFSANKEVHYTVYVKKLEYCLKTSIFPYENKNNWRIAANGKMIISEAEKDNLLFLDLDNFLGGLSASDMIEIMTKYPLSRGKITCSSWALAMAISRRRDLKKICPTLNGKKKSDKLWILDLTRNAIPAGYNLHFRPAIDEDANIIDNNSFYAYIEKNETLPIGLPLEKIEKNIPFHLKNKEGILKIKVRDFKYVGDHYPFLWNSSSKKSNFYSYVVSGTYVLHSSIYELIRKDYKGSIEYIWFLPFSHIKGEELFGKFVDECVKLKSYPKGTWQNKVGKALPCRLYGKLGSDVFTKKIYWKGKDEDFVDQLGKKDFLDNTSNSDHWKKEVIRNRRIYNYQPISIAIATKAMIMLIKEIKKYPKESLIFARTDAIGLNVYPDKTEINPDKLGAWKIEKGKITTFSGNGFALRDENNNIKIKMSGLKDKSNLNLNEIINDGNQTFKCSDIDIDDKTGKVSLVETSYSVSLFNEEFDSKLVNNTKELRKREREKRIKEEFDEDDNYQE